MLSLQDIKGPYHAIFSLGNNCLPAIELREHGLRKFAGPIDWMGTPVLPQISRMLRNRFQGMLVYANLVLVNQASEELYNIRDLEYDLYLNHDFTCTTIFRPTCRLTLTLKPNMTAGPPDFCKPWKAADVFSLFGPIRIMRR